jgi:hypothetical protein
MQIVKIGKATFFSSGQAESEEEGILLTGNLHIPITVEIQDELPNDAGESNASL